jgi:hypothetical protein
LATGNPTPNVAARPKTHFDYTGKLFNSLSFTKLFLNDCYMLFCKDPQKWDEHELNCAGLHQSPINFNTDEVVVTNYPKFTFENYNLVFPESLENNGHTGI